MSEDLAQEREKSMPMVTKLQLQGGLRPLKDVLRLKGRQGAARKTREEQRTGFFEDKGEKRKALIKQAKEIKAQQERQKLIDEKVEVVTKDLQKTGGPRDVHSVLPDPRAERRKKDLAEQEAALRREIRASIVRNEAARAKERSRQSDLELEISEERRAQLDASGRHARQERSRENPGMYLPTQSVKDRTAREAEKALGKRGREEEQAGGDESRLRTVGPMQGALAKHDLTGLKRVQHAPATGLKRGREAGEGSVPAYMEHKRLKEQQRRDQQEAGTRAMLAGMKAAAEARGTETVLKEPDVAGADPTAGTIAPSGTGQEPPSAVDADLRNLEQQLGGGEKTGVMGMQTLAGGTPGSTCRVLHRSKACLATTEASRQ